ncbi:hypothetical protein ACMAZF_18880 [Psychrobium sp. nBUS_13]|uniref:hypothetical protein n=1 Tax=Psychrobium sp. nBUS_13 TaxID=3395319 RepID=UPI003EBD89C3
MNITLIKQHCFSYLLEVHFSDDYRQLIGFEMLRVYTNLIKFVILFCEGTTNEGKALD